MPPDPSCAACRDTRLLRATRFSHLHDLTLRRTRVAFVTAGCGDFVNAGDEGDGSATTFDVELYEASHCFLGCNIRIAIE